MHDELIRQTRELCNTAETNYYIDVVIPELCDALEAAQKEIEQLKTQCDINATSFFDMREQLKNAAAERDTYKEALSHLEHMVSGERSGNRKREHSIGVMAALCKAREVLKGVE